LSGYWQARALALLAGYGFDSYGAPALLGAQGGVCRACGSGMGRVRLASGLAAGRSTLPRLPRWGGCSWVAKSEG
jgi:hypothetical protein